MGDTARHKQDAEMAQKQPATKPKPVSFIGIHIPSDTLTRIRRSAALEPSDSDKKSVSGMCRAVLVDAFPAPAKKKD